MVDLVDQSQYNILYSQKSVFDFQEKSQIAFKVKAYSFEMLMHEPLACENFDFDVTYNNPKGTSAPTIVGVQCTEINGALTYHLVFDQ